MTAERLTLTDEERAQLALDYPDSREDSNDFDRLVNVAFALGLSRGLQPAAEIADDAGEGYDRRGDKAAAGICYALLIAIDREREGGSTVVQPKEDA